MDHIIAALLAAVIAVITTAIIVITTAVIVIVDAWNVKSKRFGTCLELSIQSPKILKKKMEKVQSSTDRIDLYIIIIVIIDGVLNT